ncbi:hypothetical protein ES319_D08G030700v1 [Gossypium barbadense]|uniref:Nicotianamine synthase n=2 Tax=Gossypium TaxID=3633 RepID=A0A5J5QBR9_GOSBA|nr:hypothetical protein ES319_D08G030700v1 [Gossypium barbadense]PPD76075.1 hypothetical protein GOBAR_DD26992 [Gossypium barbadense]TYG56047.1 hypothetical protein ES288_D08G032100v1 [Gossypium darwinii]
MASALVTRIHEIYDSIVKLESLKPSEHVNTLLTHLVKLCIPPSNIIIEDLSQEIQDMRMNLILKNLDLFPYYGNYVKLAGLEYKILSEHGMVQPKKVAFVGSGPLPLTSIVMATHHLKSTHFDNFDIDEAANYVASQIIASDDEFEKRMKFVTRDIMDVTEELGEYDCIFLAALVGICKEEKIKIVGHIRKYMKGGGLLLVRSANGARAFLYPFVKELDLPGFELLSIFHPTDEVINSVVLVRKPIFHD